MIYNIQKNAFMKKRTKKGLIIGLVCGVVLCAITIPVLAIFIPKIINSNNNINKLVENQVKPLQGQEVNSKDSKYIKYSTIADIPDDKKVQTINDFAQNALSNNQGLDSFFSTVISNILTDFFKNIKGSKSYIEKFNNWIKSIDESWDSTVQSYKNSYGSNWEFYFQLKELDPVGGNEDDWKREKLFSYVNSEFDNLFNNKSYITLVKKDANGKKQPIKNITESMLFNKDVIFNATGEPCNIEFFASEPTQDPSVIQTNPSSFDIAMADLQSFVFDDYVKTQLPLITSMVLFKHEAPATDGYSKFFNIPKAKMLNGGTDPVGAEASYIWQTYNPQIFSSDGKMNATSKYNAFVKDYKDPNKKLIIDDLGGAINIPVSYTDDSATLYLIKASDVFDTSFTQYAAASIYKLNNLLYSVTDNTLPSEGEFKKVGDTLTGSSNKVQAGNEIMSNFWNYATGEQTGYFNLPEVVKSIVNNDNQYAFNGIYNGVQSITDSINIADTPFIMSRNEAGVHIIGIDRYDAIKAANSIDKKITEIKNTLLWRDLISNTTLTSGQNASSVTGFTMNLFSDIKSYYSSNRNRLLMKYILSKQKNPPQTDQEKLAYIFSDKYANMTYYEDQAKQNLISNNDVELFDTYNDSIEYGFYEKRADTVKEKVLGLQKSYIGKSYGNPSYNDAFITNGIVGMLPYQRNTTANQYTSANGVYDNVYGTYESITPRIISDGSLYKATVAKTKQDLYTTSAKKYLDAVNIENPLQIKVLTYVSSKYNQYLIVGNRDNKSNRYYAGVGDRINKSIGNWISSQQISNIVINQKIEAYLNSKNANVDMSKFTFDTSIGDITSIPTSDTNAVAFINSRLLYAYNLKQRFTTIDDTIMASMGAWNSFQTLYDILVNSNQAKIINGNYTNDQQTALKNLLTWLYAFDYDGDNRIYKFTKFRDYLLDKTSNNGRAAFVWASNEKINQIQNYTTATLQQQFTFKPKPFDVYKNTYGYAYQDASKNAIKPVVNDGTNLLFGADVTFDTRAEYWRYASPSKEISSANNSFTGFLGMQFPGNVSSSLDSGASSLIFNSGAQFYSDDNRTTYGYQGFLYNLANNRSDGMKKLNEEIGKIRNNTAKQKMLDWLMDIFNINNLQIDDSKKQQIETLEQEIIQASIGSEFVPKLIQLADLVIPDSSFQRVNKQQLVNSNVSVQQPANARYFGDVNSMASQVVVTQFNYDDVVSLFDTNNDKTINADDEGINWTSVASNGFLGVSPEAFFISAMDWYFNNTLYSTSAFNEMKENQGKITVFDRRLNDLFGEEWVENYKKNEVN